MTKLGILASVLIFQFLFCCFPSHAEKRLALIVGNGAYAQSRPLLNPVRDAIAMAKKLGSLGFEVQLETDRTKKELEISFRAFAAKSVGADIALFYYAGHGIQVSGKNYIIPVDAKLRDVSDVKFELIEISSLVANLENRAKRTLVFLDACRDNPFASSMKGYTRNHGGQGLANIDNPSLGTLVAFAAQPGSIASDGHGRHSPFTAALLANIEEPGASISQILTRVRKSVYDATNGNQIPQDYNSLLEELYLNPAESDEDRDNKIREQINALKTKIEKLKAGKQIEAAIKPQKPVSIDPKPKLKTGQKFRDCKGCPEMVVVPAGTFLIGSPESEDRRVISEGPQREITLPKPFAMGRFEVSVAEFRRYVEDYGRDPKDDINRACYEWVEKLGGGRDNRDLYWSRPGYKVKENYPVTCVSWNDAQSYVRWLSQKTGHSYRLPSEAEWEYSARAGSTTMFHFGDRINIKVANFSSWHEEPFAGARKENYWYGKPLKVNSFKPNAFGLYNMHSNVWEYVEDCYEFGYNLMPPDGLPYKRDFCEKIIRKGGSWLNFPWDLRSARRFAAGNKWREQHVGFRVLRELE